MSSQKNDSVQDDSFLPKFIKWPLDMGLEDDEFRAGYPFPSISSSSSDGKMILVLKTTYFIYTVITEDQGEDSHTTATKADIVSKKK